MPRFCLRRGAPREAGIQPREFMIVSIALITDVTAVAMKKAGTIEAFPPSISPENAAFVERNFDQLRPKLGEMK